MTKTLTSFRLLRAILIMLVLAMFVPARAAIDITATQPANGTGTTDDPYQIGTPGELYWFAAQVNGGQTTISAKLTADIVVNENVLDAGGALVGTPTNVWTPIGTNSNNFKGTFDGDGHTISGLYFNNTTNSSYPSGGNYIGLVGYASNSNMTIKNVGVVDSYFAGYSYVAGIAGRIDGGIIENCFSEATCICSSFDVAGIAGAAYNCTIKNCYNAGAISSLNNCAAGITAYNNNATIANCFNVGSIKAKGSHCGAIIGQYGSGTTTKCYYLAESATINGTVQKGTGSGDIETTLKTAEQFASGEVTFLLGDAWGQTIGTDAMPKIGGEKVYATQYIGCEGSSNYNNTGSSIIERAHTFSADNICSECGKGSKPNLNGDVYEIANYGHLLWFADTVNNHGATSLKAKLTADIVVNEDVLQPGTFNLKRTPTREWAPIGTYSNSFKGIFDGNGHSISGLYFNNTANANENMYIALIGYATGATIKNVVVKDSYLRGYNYVAGICGYATGSTKITNCGYEGYVYGTSYAYGIAYNSSATVENCYSVSNTPLSPNATTNCYHDNTKYSGSTSYSIGKSSSAFASGEVAWLLNGGSSDGPWGQTIGTDATPKLGGNKVYATAHCPHTNSYSNTPSDYIPITDGPEHYDADGFCKVCGAGHPATLVDGYYIIDDVAKLYWFAAKVNGGQTTINAKLVADIVVNDSVVDAEGNLRSDYASANLNEWSPAGVSTGNSFKGTFDGDGHTISGLYCSQSTINGAGLFGYISSATISNLTIKDSYICGRQDVGAIVGYSSSSTITNCHNQNSTIKGNSNRTGGISGYLSGSTVRLCSNTGNISTTGSYVGGVTGTIEVNSVMENCYNLGKVTTTSSYAGGISGWLYGTLSNCMNYGKVTANSYVGGILGNYSSGTISNNYYLAGCATTSGGTAGYGIAGKNSDEEAKTMASDSAALASGEVAYLLGDAWGQKIGTDAMPKIGGEKVYVTIYTECTGHSNNYSNEGPATYEKRDHDCNAEGVCTQCGLHLISTADQLYAFAAKVNAGQTTINAKLVADIVVNDSVVDAEGNLRSDYASANLNEWSPAGVSTGNSFKGTFDGDGHTISGLYYSKSNVSYAGLFGATNGATVCNLTIKDSYIYGYQHVGAVVGLAASSTITNCHNQNSTIKGNYSRIGGISGTLDSDSKISLCSNSGKVSNPSFSVAGVSGAVMGNSAMENCANYGKVTSTNNYAGGVCGYLNGTIKNCFNYGKVTASNYVGGIVGEYSSGSVSNNYYLAGSVTTTNGNVCFGISGRNADNNQQTMAKDSAKLASGEVAYLLGDAWGQKLGTDATPILGAEKVYKNIYSGECTGEEYSNVDKHGVATDRNHNCNADGMCENCGFYLISTADQLFAFAAKVNGGANTISAKLTDDIVVNDSVIDINGDLRSDYASANLREWTPIGTKSSQFKGTFDGDGHTISGLYFNNTTNSDYPSGGNYIGLVGYANGSTISNLTIKDSYVNGYKQVGAIVGWAESSTITNCHNQNSTIISTTSRIGGVSGYLSASNMSLCSNSGNIYSGSYSTGGLSGSVDNSTMENCFNYGNVTVINISADHNAGGICGWVNVGTVKNCFNYGKVTAPSKIGGIVGNYSSGTISNNYYLAGCAATTSGVVGYGIAGKNSDEEAKTMASDSADFASGVISFLLNNRVSDSTSIWRQTIGVDATPKFSGSIVYLSSPCAKQFVNDTTVYVPHTHADDHICPICGKQITIEFIEAIANKVNYKVGDSLVVDSSLVVAKYNDLTSDTIPMTMEMVSGFESNMHGSYNVTVTYNGLTTTYAITVEHELKSIAIEAPQKTQYKVGDKLDLTGGKVIITFTDNCTETLPLAESMVSGFESNMQGSYEVTLTYGGESISYAITVEHELKSIAIEAPQKTQYKVGDKLDLTGGKVIITFTDNTTETLPLTESMVSGFSSLVAGNVVVTATYMGQTITYTIEVEGGQSISEAGAEVKIYAVNRNIVVETQEADGPVISVFNISGRKVAQCVANSNYMELPMQTAGMYVVHVGNTTCKVIVK